VDVVQPAVRAKPRRLATVNWGELAWEVLKYSLVVVVLIALLTPI
jgi:hypothetical protein